MRTHLAHIFRRGAAAAALVAALVAPGGAHAANKIFAAGSLIIPVQQEYQTDEGAVATYGFIYTLLRHAEDVPLPTGCTKPFTIYWAIAPNKLSHHRCNTNTNDLPRYDGYNDNDGCDLAVQSATGVPVAELTASNTEQAPFNVYASAYTVAGGPQRGAVVSVASAAATPKKTVMKYLGGPWIIDATDRQCFLSMLTNIPELQQYHKNGASAVNSNGKKAFVAIHSARASFTAPIARIMNRKPVLIALTGGKSDFIVNVLENAGVAGPGNFQNGDIGTVYEKRTTAEWFDATAENPYGLINKVVDDKYVYGLFWGAADMGALTAAQRANLNRFIDGDGVRAGNGAYVEANSVDVIEDDLTHGPIVANGPAPAMDGTTPNVPYAEDCNDRRVGVSFYKVNGSGTQCFTHGSLSHPWTQAGNWPFEGGQAGYKGLQPLNGFAEGAMVGAKYSSTAVSVARYKENDPLVRGLVIYLAGMRFDNARMWGQRMILNSVLANVPLIRGIELARSEPVGYRDASSSDPTQADRIYQGTYFQLPDPPEAFYRNYSTSHPHRWMFPYTEGHLYQYGLADIPANSTAFVCAAQSTGACPTPTWDAALKLPDPPSRTIYTALAGSAHLRWKRVELDYQQTRSGCLDADGDKLCDLSERLAACNTAAIPTEDLLPYDDASSTQRDQLGMFVQQVRGHCSAHNPRVTGAAIMEPAASECDDQLLADRNTAKLGGIDHGSPAIVGPSRYVTDDAWKNRPVVAYAGARDGMLHAFYVSGGVGWKDPAGNAVDTSTPGKEIWAFVPPGQLCTLHTNNAMVDASVNVIDVFADFPSDVNRDGVIDWSTGSTERPDRVREWRTVLLAAAGEGGSELFALDVTNPLNPVLLWHLGGAENADGRFDVDDDGQFEAGEVFDKAKPATYAVKWFDWDDADATTAHVPTDYATTSGPVLDALKHGKHDYRNLGLTYGTAIGKILVGDAFHYVAYVATSMVDFTDATPLGFRGVEVFAIDLVSGRKLWQWERAYTRENGLSAVIADNTIPGRVALADVDSDGSVDRIYVGDLEGHLWELTARDGRNVNYLPATDAKHYSLPLFGTIDMTANGPPAASSETLGLFQVNGGSKLAQQPLTSPIGMGRFTHTRTALEPYLKGRLAIVQGAMGVDWSVAPFEPGSVYVLPIAPEKDTRVAVPVDLTKHDARLYGVLKPADYDGPGKSAASWRIPLRVGERVFGMPRVVNNEVIFNTAFGSFSGDITESVTEAGNLYQVGTTSAGEARQTVTANESKSFGGVVVFGDKLVITTDTAITKKDLPTELKPDGDPSKRPFNRFTPAIFKTWEASERPEHAPSQTTQP